jgi:hypothetical protein
MVLSETRMEMLEQEFTGSCLVFIIFDMPHTDGDIGAMNIALIQLIEMQGEEV